MKRTSNMIYKETPEARELELYLLNNSITYNQVRAVQEALARKRARGIYNSNKAIDAFYPIATYASNLYNNDFGYRFSVTDRFTVATMLRDATEEEWTWKSPLFFYL